MSRVDLDNIENNRNNESTDSKKPKLLIDVLFENIEEKLARAIEGRESTRPRGVSVETAMRELLGTEEGS
jgi:hypothetical protein